MIELIEIRFHGRGGQGAVTGVNMLSSAVHLDGKYTQAIPQYGTERRGAPVVAFCRIDDEYIRERDLIHEPDIVVVLDSALGRSVDVTKGLKDGGLIIVNHPGTYKEAGFSGSFRVATVDATTIALDTLGRIITNTAILGAFAKVTGLVNLASMEEVIKNTFPDRIVEPNIQAMHMAFESVSESMDASNVQKAKRMETISSEPIISYSRYVADWRIYRPIIDMDKCIGCKLCWIYCPETAVKIVDKKAEINYSYCKGCGICAEECLVHAIKMKLEEV